MKRERERGFSCQPTRPLIFSLSLLMMLFHLSRATQRSLIKRQFSIPIRYCCWLVGWSVDCGYIASQTHNNSEYVDIIIVFSTHSSLSLSSWSNIKSESTRSSNHLSFSSSFLTMARVSFLLNLHGIKFLWSLKSKMSAYTYIWNFQLWKKKLWKCYRRKAFPKNSRVYEIWFIALFLSVLLVRYSIPSGIYS